MSHSASPPDDPQAALQTLYQDFARETAAAQQAYPEIQCRSGCSQCCTHYGSPLILPLEWQAVKAAWRQLHPEQQAQILDQYRQLKQKLQAQLREPDFPLHAALYHTPCPFLIENRCTIYASRPLACRAFGLSQHQDMALPLTQGLATCSMEMERWEKALPMHTRPDLPFKEPFFEALKQLDTGEFATLLSYLDKEIRLGQFPT